MGKRKWCLCLLLLRFKNVFQTKFWVPMKMWNWLFKCIWCRKNKVLVFMMKHILALRLFSEAKLWDGRRLGCLPLTHPALPVTLFTYYCGDRMCLFFVSAERWPMRNAHLLPGLRLRVPGPPGRYPAQRHPYLRRGANQGRVGSYHTTPIAHFAPV